MVGQVHGEPVKAVRDRRTGRAPGSVVGPEHEVVDEELRPPAEEVSQRGASLVGLESVLLIDPHPRQGLPPPRQLVAAPRVLFLRLEQLEPLCEPVFTRPGLVLRRTCPGRGLPLACPGRALRLSCPGLVTCHALVSFLLVSAPFPLRLRGCCSPHTVGAGYRDDGSESGIPMGSCGLPVTASGACGGVASEIP